MNEFVRSQSIQTVIEFGCGDGNQLKLAEYPHYIGIDVSTTAVDKCRSIFVGANKEFYTLENYGGQTAHLALSLDVIYHLIEDDVFDRYMNTLFHAAEEYVIIYASNKDERYAAHVRHRKFTDWIDQEKSNQWTLFRHIPNKYPYNGDDQETSFAEFYIYTRRK